LPRVDDETLAAYVDGELSPEKAAAVAMLLADDPEARRRLDALFETSRLLAAAYEAPMTEPVPERLRALVEGRPDRAAAPEGARVIAFPRRARLPAAIGLALAASVALVFGLRMPDEAPFHVTAGPAAADGPLHAALEAAASGDSVAAPGGVALTPVGTYATAGGGVCREFEAVSAGGVERGLACRHGGLWRVEAVVAEAAPAAAGGDGFAPASGPAAGAFDAALDRLGLGMALDAGAEAALRARGWRAE
jgi:hypothetical protein